MYTTTTEALNAILNADRNNLTVARSNAMPYTTYSGRSDICKPYDGSLFDSTLPIRKLDFNDNSVTISYEKPKLDIMKKNDTSKEASDRFHATLDAATHMPLRIVPEGNKTVVFWRDGTATYVNVSSDDNNHFSVYTAFCAALAKKVFGSTGAVKRICDQYNTVLIEQRKKAEQLARKAEEDAKAAAAKAKREKRHIKRMAKRIFEEERIKEEVAYEVERLENAMKAKR